jgi:hypothetical protein
MIHQFLDFIDPAGAPGPDLRADVIKDGNAELFGNRRRMQVKIRKIDDDEEIRPQAF